MWYQGLVHSWASDLDFPLSSSGGQYFLTDGDWWQCFPVDPLDLSVAFAAGDHNILWSHLELMVGFTGVALSFLDFFPLFYLTGQGKADFMFIGAP